MFENDVDDHDAPPLDLPAPQRPRLSHNPVDINLIGDRCMRTEEIQLQDLLNENIDREKNLRKTHLLVQILRIITPQAGNMGNAMTRYQRSQNQQQITFSRILLCRNESKLCYIMMTTDGNRRIFHRDLTLRDNGTITIGSYLRILAPEPVERNMQGIPLVKTFAMAVAMGKIFDLPAIPINNNIEGSNTGVAVLTNAEVEVRSTTPIQTTCSGKHCDKQRPLEWCFKTNRGCGCWGTSSLGTSNIAFMLHLKVSYSNNNVFYMKYFSLQQFNTLFMDSVIPQNTAITALEHTDASNTLEDSLQECLEYINENGGFQVVVWYSRGEINDLSLVGLNAQEDAQVDSGRMNYHVVYVQPMDKTLLDNTGTRGGELAARKFRVGDNL